MGGYKKVLFFYCAVKLHLNKLLCEVLQLFFVDSLYVLQCNPYEFLGVINAKCFLPQKKSVIRPGVVTIIDTLKIGNGEVQQTKSFLFLTHWN